MNTLDRIVSPEIHPFEDIKLQSPRVLNLSNGIPLYLLSNPQLDMLHFFIQLKVGILTEQQKHITRFTYKLLKESAAKQTAPEIADLLSFYGTHYSVSVALDKTEISIAVPKQNCTKILPIIFDFIAYPTYRESNLSIFKKLQIKDLEYSSCKTDFQATKILLHSLFGEEMTAGQFSTRDNLQAVTISQMEAYHSLTFTAENIKLFATGNLDDEVETCLSNLFSTIPHQSTPLMMGHMPPITLPAPKFQTTVPNCVQSTIELGMPFFGFNHPDRYDFDVLSTILGGYFGSRLMQNLREKHGYTYSISSDAAYFGNQSIYIISSDVNVNDTIPAMNACFEEIERLQHEFVSEEELNSVKQYLLGEVIRGVDNSVSYLKKYAFWNLHGLDEHELTEVIDHIHHIKSDRVLELAKKYFNYNNFTRIIVGDKFD